MRLQLSAWLRLASCAILACNCEIHDDCDDWDDDDHDDHYHDDRGGRTSSGGASSGGNSSSGGATTAGGASTKGGGSNEGGSTCANCPVDPDPKGRQCLWGEATLDVCSTEESVARFAAEQCVALGLSLETHTPKQSCEQGFTAVRYECCSEPEVVCTERHLELTSCVSSAELETLARQTCSAVSAELADFAAENVCEEGGYCEASFTCCK